MPITVYHSQTMYCSQTIRFINQDRCLGHRSEPLNLSAKAACQHIVAELLPLLRADYPEAENGSPQWRKRLGSVHSPPIESIVSIGRELANYFAVPLEIDSRLLPRAFGIWEGLDWAAIEENFPDFWADFQELGDNFSPPGGEKLQALQERVSGWYERLLDREESQILLISPEVFQVLREACGSDTVPQSFTTTHRLKVPQDKS
jgi:hypothetical protein